MADDTHSGDVVLLVETDLWQAWRYGDLGDGQDTELESVLARALASDAKFLSRCGLTEPAEQACRWLARSALSRAVVAAAADDQMRKLGRAIELVAGIQSGQLIFVAQPIAQLGARAATGELRFELLGRVVTESGLQSAGPMIGDAMWAGLCLEIDRAAIRQAGAAVKALADRGQRTVLHVNISAPPERVLGTVEETLDSTQIDARRLCLELTENHVLGRRAAKDFVAAASRLGCHVFADDFGDGGFPPPAWIKSLGLAGIKISDVFRQAKHDPSMRRVVAAIVAQANDYGMMTIAEWVDGPAAMGLAEELGFGYVQGSHLGPEVPLEELVAHHGSGRDCDLTRAAPRLRGRRGQHRRPRRFGPSIAFGFRRDSGY